MSGKYADLIDTNFQWENLSRFKFVSIQAEEGDKPLLWLKIRENGVIRILEERVK